MQQHFTYTGKDGTEIEFDANITINFKCDDDVYSNVCEISKIEIEDASVDLTPEIRERLEEHVEENFILDEGWEYEPPDTDDNSGDGD